MRDRKRVVVGCIGRAASALAAQAKALRSWRPRVVLALAVGAGAVVAGAPVAAEQQRMGGGESVVLALDAVVTSVESIVVNGFLPNLDALKTNLREANAYAHRICAQAERSPNPTATMACDEATNAAFLGLGEDLEHLLDQRAPVLQAIDGFAAAIGDARFVSDERASQLVGESEERRQEAADSLATLAELHEQYADHIADDRPLPPAVDFKVRGLAQQLSIAEMRAGVAEQKGARLDWARTELTRADEHVQAVRNEYVLIFHQAEGQFTFVGEAAELLATQVETEGFTRQVNGLADQLGGISAGLDAIAVDVNALVTDALGAAPPEAADLRELDRHTGLEILRRFFPSGASSDANGS